MGKFYTDERNAQIVIALMKAHNIRKVIASPGTTNACIVASLQNDPYFEIFSAAEERSAGYIACGFAAESGEPVALSCTGATASRNYMPALTEAYYRKLPVLAITSSRRNAFIGHNMDQVTDRTQLPKDIANLSVRLPIVHDEISEWECVIAANKAMLEVRHRGGGPAHINLETTYSQKSVKEITPVKAIYRYTNRDKLPELICDRVAIIVGAHVKWSEKLVSSVDAFCKVYNGIVICDQQSNYKGKYRVFPTVALMQRDCADAIKMVDTVIHIGDVSSSTFDQIKMQKVWRVNPDGELRDTFRQLQYVFEFDEEDFFSTYASMVNREGEDKFLTECKFEEFNLFKNIPDLPFSNAWAASVTANRLPKNSVLHLGIRNTIRTWNYFDVPNSVLSYANTGGFGIDGSLSSVIGAALVNKERLYYCVLGDLAFFYDMNALGNRHLCSNIRILLVNNGLGMEMKFSFALGHRIASALETSEDKNITAAGHYGQKSSVLVKHYAEDLGIEYLSASSKEEYHEKIERFLNAQKTDRPMLFEIFVEPKDEDEAIKKMHRVKKEKYSEVKDAVRDIVGDNGVKTLKKAMKRLGIRK
jgi:2-succinyl-5-enolpyruvyl-6-hydroxy-3-cyclohexene-1-carboxylate synthase